MLADSHTVCYAGFLLVLPGQTFTQGWGTGECLVPTSGFCGMAYVRMLAWPIAFQNICKGCVIALSIT